MVNLESIRACIRNAKIMEVTCPGLFAYRIENDAGTNDDDASIAKAWDWPVPRIVDFTSSDFLRPNRDRSDSQDRIMLAFRKSRTYQSMV